VRISVDKVLITILISAILGGIASLGFTIASPAGGRDFTEFYIVGLGGQAGDYPNDLTIGEECEVRVGIISRERETTTYRVAIAIDGTRQAETDLITLAPDDKWEDIIRFRPQKVGDNQKVTFLLYKNGATEPYLELYLWVNVKEQNRGYIW
jgi:uncharacterized membrane protein